MSGKNIHQRLAAITAELQTVAKNLNVETGKGKSYKAVSERDVIDAVKPLELKHGVYSYPSGRIVLESETLESESSYGKKTTFFERIQTTYRFVNVDDPADYIETTTFAEGIDSQDKGSGKAMTYADKYALMKAYKISTGDDPDQNASEETRYTRIPKSARPDYNAEYEPPERTPRNAVIGRNQDFTPICADCGKAITDKIHDYSAKKFGKPLCYNCQNKAKSYDRFLDNEAYGLQHEDAGDRI